MIVCLLILFFFISVGCCFSFFFSCHLQMFHHFQKNFLLGVFVVVSIRFLFVHAIRFLFADDKFCSHSFIFPLFLFFSLFPFVCMSICRFNLASILDVSLLHSFSLALSNIYVVDRFDTNVLVGHIFALCAYHFPPTKLEIIRFYFVTM